MRRSARLAKRAESEDEAPAVKLKTPRSTSKKVRPTTSSVKSNSRTKKIIDESKEDKDIANLSDEVENKVASKELFPVHEVDQSNSSEVLRNQSEVSTNLNVEIEKINHYGKDVAESTDSPSIAASRRSIKKDRPKNETAVSSPKKNGYPSKAKSPRKTREVSELPDVEETEIASSKDPYPVTEIDIIESQTLNKEILSPAKTESAQEKIKEIKSDDDDDITRESQKSSSYIAKKETLGSLDENAIPNSTKESSFQVISKVETSESIDDLNASKALSDIIEESNNSLPQMESSEKEPSIDVLVGESPRKESNTAISISGSLRCKPKVGNRKPTRKFNFNSTGSKDGKNNLLKLTSDIFKNIAFNLTKEDILGEKSDKTKKLKNSEADVHKLDVISLKDDNDKVVKDTAQGELSSELDPRCDTKDLYFDINKHGPVELKSVKPKKKELSVMKKSVLGPGLEKMEAAPKVNESFREKRKKKKKEEGETAGPGWFNMPKTEMTEELKKDLQIIKMRNLLDSKRFYKSADKKMPKYFQVGRVIEGATEFYSSRISKKERKRTMVDELLEDAEFRRKNKKKYLEIQSKKESGGKKYYKKMKNKRKETWAKS